MQSVSNVKIGKKIAFVLGGMVLLLTGLAALSSWGLHTSRQRLSEYTKKHLAKAQLAATIASEPSNISISVAKTVPAKFAAAASLKEMSEFGKNRDAPLEQFKAGVNTPESTRDGFEMIEIALARTAADDGIVARLRAGVRRRLEVP